MKTNLEIYNEIKNLPNFSLASVFHIGSSYYTDDFYQFARLLDEADLLVLGIDIPHSKLLKYVINKTQPDIIIEKQKFGWLIEVYFPHILGEIKDKKGRLTGYEFSNQNSHASLIYNESYEAAIERAIEISKEWVERDLDKLK